MAPGGGLLNSTSCSTVYTYMGHAWFALSDPSKGHYVQLTLVYSQFYTSCRLRRQINAIWLISSKLKTASTVSYKKILYFRFYSSRRSTHRVVNAQPGDLSTLNLFSFIYFCRQIDCNEVLCLKILTRNTTGPVKLLFYFCSFPHRVVSEQPGIQQLSKPYLSVVQYIEYHCIRVQKIPAFKSTSTKWLFLFQFYTIVNRNQNFDFGTSNCTYMYQLMEKVVGNNWNFNIFQSSLNLSIILFLELKHLLKFQ